MRLSLKRVPNPNHTPTSGCAAPCNGSDECSQNLPSPFPLGETRELEHRGWHGGADLGIEEGYRTGQKALRVDSTRPGPTSHPHFLLPRAHTQRVVTEQVTPKESLVRPGQGLSWGARFPDRTCAQPIICRKQDFHQE